MKEKFLILCGDGINCENETALALQTHHFDTDIMHINILLDSPQKLLDYQGLVLPGGFSFGDELGSGQILALKMKNYLSDTLNEFLQAPRAVLGICNGFQVLVKLGLLPQAELGRPQASLRSNRQKQFLNRWVDLEISEEHNSRWLPQGSQKITLPVRHAEGNLFFSPALDLDRQKPLRYCEDINGSIDKLAALSDPSGWVLGLMPHPEAACFPAQTPRVLEGRCDGTIFFKQIKYSLQQS